MILCMVLFADKIIRFSIRRKELSHTSEMTAGQLLFYVNLYLFARESPPPQIAGELIPNQMKSDESGVFTKKPL